MRARVGAPVTGLAMGSPFASIIPGTLRRATLPSTSTSKSIVVKIGSCNFSVIVERI